MKAATMNDGTDSDKAIKKQMHEIGQKARAAALTLSVAPDDKKSVALRKAADALRENLERILAANAKDVKEAKAAGLDTAMLDRLTLTPERIDSMAKGLEAIATLPDPVGRMLAEWDRPNGLKLSRISVPLGVIGIIYESRPNVTADASGLCIKSGNAVILRGGSESFNSSEAIVRCIHKGLEDAGLSKDAVQLIPTRDRAAVGEMLRMTGVIDVIIPRGGKGLCERVQEESRVPTLLHLDGNCHTYIHNKANPSMAQEVVLNAKMRRTGICGATESLVIDQAVAPTILPMIAEALSEAGCEMRGDSASQAIDGRIIRASESDWGTEYLASIVSVKIVGGIEEAIPFINRYSSHHTDAIITDDSSAASRFLQHIDSAIVMHNASTQFADGGEFGMGAEIGISTGRLHARGPVGAEQLTTYKYVVQGTGQIRPKG
ncbi:MAG: proA [Rickettsiales bacterium]|jgi:glutamate-5-semialdehyde dehydrogenase|nr:proA [Rickettsiales bacterium]